MAERKIGEIFEYNGEWYQCVKGDECKYCNLRNIMCHRDTDLFPPNKCVGAYRKDNTSVIFKKFEKVGEPFELLIDTNKKVLMQEYKIYGDMYIWENKGVLHTDCFNGIRIEIKQNKEDMEEKKIQLKQEDIDYLTRKIRYLVYLQCYFNNGKCCHNETSDYDLMMLPEKKEGYANIYRSQIYDTLERAKEAYKRTCNDDNYLQTIRVEWEE